MRSSSDPNASIQDIVDNAERIAAYLGAKNLAEFGADPKTRDAVERCLERICEAAYRLGPRAAELMPGQPWSDIRGMGNRLRHGYDRIDVAVLWNAVTIEVPALKASAVAALGSP